MTLGAPRLGCGWDSEAAEAGAAEMRVPRGRRSREAAGPFRPTKAGLNRGAHNSMKGRAWAVWIQTGITLLRGVTYKLLTSTLGGVAAPFVRSVRR